MVNCGEIREKLTEIKTLKEELASGLAKAQNDKDTLILVNLQGQIEEKLESLEEIFPINLEILEKRHKKNEPLSRRALRFIYKLDKLFDKKIEVRGENIKDRRGQIEQERKSTRKQDLSKALDCEEYQISLTEEEALSGNIKYHYGHLDFPELTFAENLKLPDHVGGSLGFNKLQNAKNIKLPKTIGGSLNLVRLTCSTGLTFPESIGGYLHLSSITSVDGLIFPKSIGSSLNLCRLTDDTGLKLPESVGGYLDIRSLTSAEILKLPNHVGGSVFLNSLESIKSLNLPKEVEGKIFLNKLPQEEKEALKKKYPHLADRIQ